VKGYSVLIRDPNEVKSPSKKKKGKGTFLVLLHRLRRYVVDLLLSLKLPLLLLHPPQVEELPVLCSHR